MNEIKKMLISQLKTIGFLSMSLAPLAACFALLDGLGFPDSISATYYRCSMPFLVGTLVAAGMYLVNYVGYDNTDKWLSRISGIFGIMIVLFPCSATTLSHVGFLQLPVYTSSTIHGISALIFFLLQTYIIGVQFRKGDLNPTENKKLRNKVFTACALSILISSISLAIINYFVMIPHFVWVVEAFALVPLGFAYTVKGRSWRFLNDEDI